ncbi:phospholipase A and acyltransferase 3-like [Mytilus trossulus]|uniref:phospholipase A and acyltransferase 3-like n=1 Tax=Mytilus trossulus TaxID=6551 RepID=UPI0030048A65
MERYLVENHNRLVLDSLEPGDLIAIKDHILYSHWAVYAGNEQVIHMTGNGPEGVVASDSGHSFSIAGKSFAKCVVKIENFWKVVANGIAKKNNKKDEENMPFRGRDIVRRALDMIGPIEYNLLWQNCEHFASWCRYDKKMSAQVDKVKAVRTLVVGIVVVGGLLHEILKLFKDDD